MSDNQELSYPEGSAAAQYEARTSDRNPYIKRAEEAAMLTLPSICPKRGSTGDTIFHSPYQSVGARGVKNLGAKLLLALLPPNAPFFKLSVEEFTLEEMTGGDTEAKTEVESTLNKMERTVQTHIEQTSTRVTLSEALLHLLITGNALLFIPEDGNTRMFPLSQFIVERDPAGKVLWICTKEELSKSVLTEAQKLLLEQETPEQQKKRGDKTVCLFTMVKLDGDTWNVHQELNGIRVPDSEGTYPKDASAYIPMRFRKVDGEHYGRGFVEENVGDLRSLEGLSQALVEGAAGIAKLLILVNPNGVTSKKTVASSPNMAVRDGKADDVTFLRSDKGGDLSFAQQYADTIEKRLELAFLLHSAVQRQAERVTAEEVRYVAMELEDTLGGIYSILSLEGQTPIANRYLTILQKSKKLPVLPKDAVRPQIITGLEALGRGHDLSRLDAFISGVQAMGITDIDTYINIPAVLKKRAIAVGVDEALVRTPEEAAQIQQQRQMAALAEKAAPNAVTQYGTAVREQQSADNPATN